MGFASLIYGPHQFAPGQEYKQFQHRFACILILVSMAVTGLFVGAGGRAE